ncbi:MAG: type II secretion system protein GspG [Candidatus Wallbacteria bacterium]|nr:type II secretion system protein GspG [Candidatus Wallbacteria bacterium]
MWKYASYKEHCLTDAEKCHLKMSALRNAYYKCFLDMAELPTHSSRLLDPPADEKKRTKWKGPYLTKDYLIKGDPYGYFQDPWGHYFVIFYDVLKPYGLKIFSYGPNGKFDAEPADNFSYWSPTTSLSGDDLCDVFWGECGIFNYPGRFLTQIPVIPQDTFDVHIDSRFPSQQTSKFIFGNRDKKIETALVLYFFNPEGTRRFKERESEVISELIKKMETYDFRKNEKVLSAFTLNYHLLESINQQIPKKKNKVAGLWFAEFRILDSEN